MANESSSNIVQDKTWNHLHKKIITKTAAIPIISKATNAPLNISCFDRTYKVGSSSLVFKLRPIAFFTLAFKLVEPFFILYEKFLVIVLRDSILSFGVKVSLVTDSKIE